MFLKRLELVGFKSFAPPTAIDLETGIAVFVGPNGAGKSNIADAVQWALGEQSARAVRGKRSEDVIFAGSSVRAPLGMAEVSLVLDNVDQRIPLPYGEVRITRRLYRSGDSEYLLNGSRVRLKDIAECLGHSGLGTDTYCVIGQGAVEELVLQRPEERRLAFESAADVRRYQLKLSETRSRLGSAEQNLARCQDVMLELEPHLRRMRGQAERAERARRVRSELSGVATLWFRRRLAELEAGSEQAERAHQAAEAQRGELEAAVAARESAWRDLEAEAEDGERRLQSIRGKVGELHSERERLEREAAVAEERVAQLQRRLGGEGVDGVDLRQRLSVLGNELVAARRGCQHLRARLADQQGRLAAAREQVQTEERELARLRGSTADLEQRRARMVAEQEQISRQESAAETRAELLRNEVAENARLESEAAATADELRSRLAAGRQQTQALAQRLAEASAESAARRQEHDELLQAVVALERTSLEVERQRVGLEAGLGQLGRSGASGPGSELPPDAAEHAESVLGVLGDHLWVPSRYETAVDAALGGVARAVLVSRSSEVVRLAARLSNQPGRWTLVALESADGLATETFKRRVRGMLEGCAAHGFADELVEAPAELRALTAWWLGRSVIVDDSAVAEVSRRLSSSQELSRPWQVVSLSGHRVRSSGEWMVGLGHEVDPLLGRERERRRLSEELASARERVRRVESGLAEQRRNVETAAARQDAATERAATLESELRASRSELNALERELERRDEDRAQALRRLAAAKLALGELEKARSTRQRAHLRTLQEIDGLTSRLEEVRVEVREHEQRLAAARAEVGTSETGIAVQEAELRSTESLERRLAAEAEAGRSALERVAGERVGLLEEKREQERRLDEQRARLQALQSVLHPLQQELAACETARQGRTEERRRLEQAMGTLRQELRAADEAWQETSLARARIADELERTRREATEVLELYGEEGESDQPLQLGFRPDEVPREMARRGDTEAPRFRAERAALAAPGSLSESVDDAVVDMAAVRRRLNSLQRELRVIGPVSDETLEQYGELSERHDFLNRQSADLRATIVELRQAMVELEEVIVERLRATFDRVSAAFQETFVSLFGGGSAELLLTQPENLLEAGIEVVARPPGKRLQGLMGLSGGERALTAVALLFALLRINPTPFVLLDEVDAALDDVNVHRFADLLKSYAKEIQFIVVSHNRATMESATALFGVSMGADSISRVLSLRLAEAQQAGA